MGLGRLSSMPGTLSASVACFAILPFCSTPVLAVAISLMLPVGVWACGGLSSDEGRDSGVAIDHAVGVWVAMLGHVTSSDTMGFAVPALFLFRVFGLLRSFPVSLFARMPGGLGIMGDDVAAGIVTNLVLWGIRWIFMGQSPFILPIG